MQVPRNSRGGFLDENSEDEEDEEDERSNKNEGVSKSKKPASRNVKKNIRKGKKWFCELAYETSLYVTFHV